MLFQTEALYFSILLHLLLRKWGNHGSLNMFSVVQIIACSFMEILAEHDEDHGS